MDFVGEPTVGKGVAERRFDVKSDDRVVPGLLWTPENAAGPRPLVLIGHGGGGDKRMEYVLGLARRLVRHQGWAAAAIDGVGHGERADATGAADAAAASGRGIPADFTDRIAGAADAMVADWAATLAALQELDEVGHGPLGYWGLSMGTMFGAPFVAATPEVRVAVLGLMGDLDAAHPWSTSAAAITQPVLFLAQLDDELVPFDGAVSLFRNLGSADKRMHAHPGLHSAVPIEEIEASEAFLAAHLG
jgi:dienelactone hydrolase